jgi:DNA-binding response OmpR family regulator
MYDLKGATILVVDDNPTNLDALSDYLTEFGITVLLKQDGKKALALIERRSLDLILLDIVMPEMDGFETCRRLKEFPETRDIPVIFMSALSDTVDKVKGFELGAVDYITKPFQYEEVLARVKAHLTIQNLQKDLQAKNKKLQEMLERERKTLERERKFIEDLRLNLSISLPHELRTPLNGILGFSQLLTKPQGLPGPDQIIDYAQRIHKSGLRLNRLIENSLLYANLKLLRYTPKDRKMWQSDTSVHAESFITSVAQKKAEETQREEDLILELEPIIIRISPNNFEKILIELLDNAFKFSQEGTRVHIRTTINGHLCIVSITDQGRGMTEEQIENIGAYVQFERKFYEQQGAGMGLIIAYLLAQLEGGVLSIDSKAGDGTTISIVLNCEPYSPEDALNQENQQQIEENPAPVSEISKKEKHPIPPLVLPPEEEIEKLYELAVTAHIQAIEEQLETIEKLGAQYAPFIDQLHRFTEEYRLDLFQEFLKTHLKK